MNTQKTAGAAYFLVGPTACGKTETTQYLAEQQGWDILSADSMLVYKGMDKGTAKPTAAERSRVRYWGIDLVEPSETFSVGLWRAAALEAVGQVARKGGALIVAGGTGLYIKALTHGLDPLPAAAPERRAAWERLYKERGVEALAEALARLDEKRLLALRDKRNPRRLIRELEIAEQGAHHRNVWQRCGTGHVMAGLLWPREVLRRRILERARRMFEQGLIEEVRQFKAAGIKFSASAAAAIGYKEAQAVLAGAMTVAEAIEATATRTAQLAKRQMTWFRHQANVEWLEVNAETSIKEIAEKVLACWERHGPIPLAG